MILSKRTKEPTTCFICQGVSSAIGVVKHNAKGYPQGSFDGWTCHHCIQTAAKVIEMKPDAINLIESMAIETIGRSSGLIEEGIQVFIGALYDAGVRNLDDATDAQISLAKDALVVNAGAVIMVQNIVLAFGEEVKAAVERGDAPF